MEKYKLIQNKFCISIFSILIVLVFCTYQPLANSEEDIHVFKLQTKEPFEIRNGRIIYLEHCAPCHGNAGKGNGKYYASSLEPKPRDFTNSEFMNKVNDEYLNDVIRKGTAAFGKSPYCPPWENTLKEDEKIENIIAFLRTFAGK